MELSFLSKKKNSLKETKSIPGYLFDSQYSQKTDGENIFLTHGLNVTVTSQWVNLS